MASPEIQQMVMDANAVTTIANNINSMYSDAIALFTTYTLAVVGLVGILIPILVTIYQWRSMKTERENLEAVIREESDKTKLAIRDELKSELAAELLTQIDNKFAELNKQLACARASSFHLQGISSVKDKHFSLAAEDFSIATVNYLKGDDELNGQRTLKMLVEKCLPNIDKQLYELATDLEKSLEDLTNFLKDNNKNGRYADRISSLVRERNNAKIREPEATAVED